jgi:hypothetical protein
VFSFLTSIRVIGIMTKEFPLPADNLSAAEAGSSSIAFVYARKWLRGRASPCQGEGRGFESRLPLSHSLDISICMQYDVPLAQPDRAFDYESKGREFESLRARHCRDVAQLGRALGSGPRGRRFKSCRLDHSPITTIRYSDIDSEVLRTRSGRAFFAFDLTHTGWPSTELAAKPMPEAASMPVKRLTEPPGRLQIQGLVADI